jgi:hypothetical protein
MVNQPSDGGYHMSSQALAIADFGPATARPVALYQPPRLEGVAHPVPDANEWFVLVIALVLAIIRYGSLWAFCVATCGIGHVQTCESQWGIFAKVVCHP